MEFNRSERTILRELASEVYEEETRRVLAGLDASFREWRRRQRLSSDLPREILQKLNLKHWDRDGP